jgi:preprotein translocase subunit SecF
MQLIPSGKIFDFMAQRRVLGTISFLMVAASIVALFEPGPRLGTDFKGGTELELNFHSDMTDDQIRNAVTASGFSSPDVIRVHDAGEKNRFLIRVQEVSSIDEKSQAEIERALCYGDNLDPGVCPENAQASEVKFSPGGDKITVRYRSTPDLSKIKEAMLSGPGGVEMRGGESNPTLQNARENKVEIQLKSKGDQLMDGLRRTLGADVVPAAPLRVEWVGPKAGALLRDAAIKSILIALVFIMIYIAVRFDLRFAPGAVIALAHDSLATLGVLILLDKEVNLTTVAALLTIVGYSINDTVVVFDRVRENLGKLRGSGFLKIINISLSEMLNRTLLTSGTTIFSLLAFFLWGTGTLKDFALTLVVGIVFGTYSSIYIALPITHWLDKRFFNRFGDNAAGTRKAVRAKKEAAVV